MNQHLLIYLLTILLVTLSGAGLTQAAGTYTNPVIPSVGPADPTILLHNGIYYMYPTGDTVSFNVYTSYDLVHWNWAAKVFEGRGGLWAPDVYYHEADRKFYMWYTSDWQIGLAVADSPTGPFIDRGIVLSGYIDAHLFRDDDGRFYLYYTDLAHVYVHPMSSPAQLTGGPQVILVPSQPWEMMSGSVNEGPWIMKHNGLYYLLYSGSGADSDFYSIGYATATHPMGPFTKFEGNPIIHGGGGVHGPGHGAVTTDATGNLWHIYHQKVGAELSYERFICIDPMWFDEHGVLHSRATRGSSHPAPAKALNRRVSAYWRFETGPAGAPVPHPQPDGTFYLSVPDSAGNGNELSVWNEGDAGYVFRSEVACATLRQTDAPNRFSVKNSGGAPALWTHSEDQVSSITPKAFTIEATFKLEDGGYRTLIGRDSWGTNTAGDNPNENLAALYLQALPNNALAIKFCDMAGYWHEAVSADHAFESFDYSSNPDGAGVPWYSMAAVSDGSNLSLYLLNHDNPEAGYQRIAHTEMTRVNPSPDTALTRGGGDGPDWNAGCWTVGRGLYEGGHRDRAWGYIDEVRISPLALTETDFLFADPNTGTVAYWRFEEGTAGRPVPHGGLADGLFYPGVPDVSGNGNHLSAWSEGLGAYVFRNEVPLTTVPQIGAANQLSVQNADDKPGLFTSSAEADTTGVDLETWQPLEFTIEASFKPQPGGHRTLVGRDGLEVTGVEARLAGLYLQLQPDDSMAIKFADISGHWHEAVSAPGIIRYDGGGRWYHAAAVCDGAQLRLYLNDVAANTGYRLVALSDMTASGSPDRRLAADDTQFVGSDWHGGGWTVGRGLFNGEHTDRFIGFIDEVRIRGEALEPKDFLFYVGVTATPSDLLVYEGEAGKALFFALDTPPTSDIALVVTEEYGRGQVVLSPSSLNFTPVNWNLPQPVHVTAAEDADLENAEHEVSLALTLSGADPKYDGLAVDPVTVKVADNECGSRGYLISDLTLDCSIDINDLVRLAEGWLDCSHPGGSGCVDYSGI